MKDREDESIKREKLISMRTVFIAQMLRSYEQIKHVIKFD